MEMFISSHDQPVEINFGNVDTKIEIANGI